MHWKPRRARSASHSSGRIYEPLSRRSLFATLAAGALGGATAVAVDDFASLFSSAPEGPAQDIKYRTGVIQTWNKATLENTVLVGNALLTDVAVLGVAEAASFTTGTVVGILSIRSANGANTWAIIGRMVQPGTADATDAMSALGSNVQFDFVTASETTTSVSFTDLTTVGPTVNVNIGASGKVLIFCAATIAISPDALETWGGFMNVQLTGANTVAPASVPGGLGYSIIAQASPDFLEISMTRMIPLSGLNPGETMFQAKYAIGVGASGETARFRNRSVAVFTL